VTTAGGPIRRALRYFRKSFLEGAAMSAAAMHGWLYHEYFRSDVAHREDNE
jgi:hypothetical protein